VRFLLDFTRFLPLNLPFSYNMMYSLRCKILLWHGGNSLAEVRLQEGEPLENALRRFKRKVQTEDIIKEVKRHSYYLKPGEKKRVKQALARKRAKKKIRKDRDSRPDRD
jgi:small subunit ribosomal protein S21